MTETTHPDPTAAGPVARMASPPDPPRTLTPRGNRWAWLEPRVRVWWTSALLLAVIGAYFVISEVRSSSSDRRLVATGLKVNATITAIVVSGGSPGRDRSILPAERGEFTMSFPIPGGDSLIIERSRLRDQRDPYKVGNSMTLYVDSARLKDWDAKDTSLWTDRLQTTLREDLLLGLIILPFVNLLLILAVMQRIRVVRIWRFGQAMAAIVVEIRQTPSSPFSRLVRFALRDSRDRRVFKVIVPMRVAQFQTGDLFWVVAKPNRPDQAVVAALYQ